MAFLLYLFGEKYIVAEKRTVLLESSPKGSLRLFAAFPGGPFRFSCSIILLLYIAYVYYVL